MSSEVWHEGKRKLGMHLFVLDGVAASAMFSLTSAFLVAYALALGADSLYIGLLSSVPNIFWTAALIPAAVFAQKHMEKRKWIVVASATASRLLWLPILLLPVYFLTGALPYLLLLVTLSTLVGAFATPAWASLTGDLVPDAMRGRYFSKRTIATVISGLAASLAGGWMLDYYGRENPFGFVVVFGMGLLIGLLSSFFYSRIPEPPVKAAKHVDFSEAARQALSNKRFRKFLLLFFFWQFAVMFAAPFFNVQLLKVMGADYIWISILAVFGGAAGVLVQRAWGIFSDTYGHRVITIISAFGIILVPLLWIPVRDPLFLIPIEIYGGIVWAGFTLAHYNYMLEVSPSQSRPVFAALFSIAFGLAGIIAPVLGGLTADYFATASFYGLTHIQPVFLISSALRLVAAIMFAAFLAEVVEKRERVAPSYVFGQLLRYGLLGSVMKVHTAEGAVVRAEKSFAKVLRKAGSEVRKEAHALEAALERTSQQADRKSEKIIEGTDELEEKVRQHYARRQG
jgi:MFS family permease